MYHGKRLQHTIARAFSADSTLLNSSSTLFNGRSEGCSYHEGACENVLHFESKSVTSVERYERFRRGLVEVVLEVKV